MKRAGHLLQPMRTRGLMAALFAVLLHAFIPPGYMVQHGDADHAVAITWCSGVSASLVWDTDTGEVRAAGDPRDDDDGKDNSAHGGACPFALAGAPIVPVSPPVLAPQPHAVRVENVRVETRLALARREGPPMPARGPPQSV